MVKEQGRPVNLAGNRETLRETPPIGKRCGRVAVALLGVVAVFGHAVSPVGLARAQDAPAKKDADSKPDAPRESATDAPAQGPEPASAEPLSVRYRFIERYSTTEDSNYPDRLTQYRVGLRETQKNEREKQQGAPERVQFSHQTIYTERAAQVGKLGELISAVRRYDRFQMKNMASIVPSKLFEGLTIWYRLQPGQKPTILNLSTDRPLNEDEYSKTTKQVFLPQLTALLPPTPKLVGDTWTIPPKAAQVLVGEMPSSDDDYEMTGSLVEVRKPDPAAPLTAVIRISGQLTLSTGLSSLNAQIHFVFGAPAALLPAVGTDAAPKSVTSPAPKSGRRRDEGVTDARGYIARVLMAWKATNVLPDDEGRLKQTRTYELDLERRVSPTSTVPETGLSAPLLIPDPIPTPNETNSWLLFVDPRQRFYLLHPQNLALNQDMSTLDNLHFVDQDHALGKDAFILTLPPGSQDPQADRKFREVGEFQRGIAAHWAKMNLETLPGPAGWLPQADWAPMRVFRKELAVKTKGADEGGVGVQRIYIDHYLVLSTGKDCFQGESWTISDNHVAFRAQSERIIKSFHFGKWDGQPMTPAATPAPPLTPPG